jgi:hypothetical protein
MDECVQLELQYAERSNNAQPPAWRLHVLVLCVDTLRMEHGAAIRESGFFCVSLEESS